MTGLVLPAHLQDPVLSDEQQQVVDAAQAGRNVLVDAPIGGGKTSTIQQLCKVMSQTHSILYLTYSRLLKADAQARVGGAFVQNYHGLVYPYLLKLGLSPGISESIPAFNNNFLHISASFKHYDMLVIDEYQDINSDYAELVRNVVSTNPLMQIVMVGDMDQKVSDSTTLDASVFAKEMVGADAAVVTFTQSFRMGPVMGELLSKAWNKPITGANPAQEVVYLKHEEAIDLIVATDPADLLCLGKRLGAMPHALNQAERIAPDKYNKSTVYASIRNSDVNARPSETSAVFTTFDSSKGMERPVCVVFDYTPETWMMRQRMVDSDPVIMRNVFLVAASRGKGKIVFVRSGDAEHVEIPPEGIGMIPVGAFKDLLSKTRPVYEKPIAVSTAFDFKYAENVRACMDLLVRRRVDDGAGPDIDIERTDGLIDLSPAVGVYQEALFFDDFDALRVLLSMSADGSFVGDALRGEVSGDPWRDSLVLAAAETEQLRYHRQVTVSVSAEHEAALVTRLGTLLSRDAMTQRGLGWEGQAMASQTEVSPLHFVGRADVIADQAIWELKFVTALDPTMFLQAAMYLVMAQHDGIDVERAYLWNTRTNERWEITVPDVKRFMDAVTVCTTKQEYRVFVSD